MARTVMRAAALAIIGLTMAVQVPAAVTLVEDQRAACTIVIGAQPHDAYVHTMHNSDVTRRLPAELIRDAAEDLAAHLHEMGRVWDPEHQIDIVDDARAVHTPHRILLGSAAIETHGLHEQAEQLPYPGYIYGVIGNDLVIFGSSAKGTANGVYGFLQDELGVRWFGAKPLFHVVPDQPTITIEGLRKRQVPSYLGRLVHVGSTTDSVNFKWGRRYMRMVETVDEHEPLRNTSHSLWRIFPTKKYLEEHPEYYAVRNGRRQKPHGDGRAARNYAICYSNPDVAAIAMRAALDYFRADPKRHTFGLGINDGLAYCECATCEQLQPERSFRGQRVASDMYFHFVNEVARRVHKVHPDKYLGVIAYNDVTAPPLEGVAKNVHVVLVNDVAEYYDPSYQARDEQLVAAWQQKGITLGMYYYTQLAKLVPAYYPRHIAGQLKDKHTRNFTSVTVEMGQGWPWHGPMPYIESRLLWDIDLDVDELLDEYFTQLYGPAAEPMQNLYERFEDIHMRERPSGGFLFEHYNEAQFRPYTGEDLTYIRQQLDVAHAAFPSLGIYHDKDGLPQRRVAYVSNGLKVFLDMLEGRLLANELAAATARGEGWSDDVAALQTLDTVRQINTILSRHATLYRDTIIRDRALPGRFRRDTCTPVRDQWKRRLAVAVGDALVGLHGAAASGLLDDRVKSAIDDATARYTADPFRRAMFDYRTGQMKPGDNLVTNPGFESLGSASRFPAHLEWTPAEPTGWAYWQQSPGMGAFSTTTEHVHSGKRAGVMHGVGNGFFIALVQNVQGGQPHHVQTFVKNVAQVVREDKPAVELEVRWLDEDDRWMSRTLSFSVETSRLDEWVKLEFIIKAPADAASAVIMVNASPLLNDEQVYVDDVSFRLLEPANR